MDIPPFDMDHVELIDPRARHHRPIGFGENPALEQQDAMVVVRNERRLRQHRALDALGAQPRTPERIGLHAAAAGPGIGPPCFPWRTATICARIASAVSSAVWAPRSRPVLINLAARARGVFLLPMAPI